MKQILIAGLLLVKSTMADASEVSKLFSRMQTYSAQFKQLVFQDHTLVQNSTGTVLLKKPVKFRWDYQSPEQMQLVSDGKKFYHYDIDLAQATVKPVSQIADAGLVALLSDNADIDSMFKTRSLTYDQALKELSSLSEERKKLLKKGYKYYLLTSKSLSSKEGQPQSMVIGVNFFDQMAFFYTTDEFGENVFVFSNIRQNASIADSQFIFAPAGDVDILE